MELVQLLFHLYSHHLAHGDTACINLGSAKGNGREPKSCLGRVFNFKLGPFVMYAMAWHIQKHALA
jgi:hypothetical protein